MINRTDIAKIKDEIADALMQGAVFDGLTWDAVEAAAESTGHETAMARAVFPDGLNDALSHFVDLIDRQMLEKLGDTDIADMRIRDRITLAVRTRLELLAPYKEAVKLSMLYWSVPPRQFLASRLVWRTADKIWNWAGDTATDYNYYTKRGLLSGVITSTMMAWVGDRTGDDAGDSLETAFDFLDRRIDNVMQFGRILGRIKK